MKKKTAKKKVKKAVKKVKNLFVNFVLDETGSMMSCLDVTISGFNEYIGTLKKKKMGDIRLTLNKFDSEGIRTLCDGVDVVKVPKLNNDNYIPGSMTPLYDTIAKTIKTTEEKVKSLKKKYEVLCVIMTDGYENASTKYGIKEVMKLIKSKEKAGWIFTYLGANQDAWAVGKSLGMKIGNVATYSTSKTTETFATLASCNVAYANTSAVSDTYGAMFTTEDKKKMQDNDE